MTLQSYLFILFVDLSKNVYTILLIFRIITMTYQYDGVRSFLDSEFISFGFWDLSLTRYFVVLFCRLVGCVVRLSVLIRLFVSILLL